MSDVLTETLLEMHFHQAIVSYFANAYGVNFLRLLKPSTQQEVWVGFDQGWVYTSLTTRELLHELRSSIQVKPNSIDRFFLGFFLQFKPVKKMIRKSKAMPDDYIVPYYRSELSVKPNRRTGLSQHETLLRLNKLNNARVSYVCALLFDLNEIYKPPNLDRLRCIDLSTSPDGWATNERHFLTFQNEMDPTCLWCSDPVEGKSLSFGDWASPNSHTGPHKLSSVSFVQLKAIGSENCEK